MKKKAVQNFSKKDEEFVNVLIDLGTKWPVARVLVYLLNREEGTMRDIENVANMRQSEVSHAVSYMVEQGWVRTEDVRPEKIGRPIKIVSLAIPRDEIARTIGDEKKNHADHQLSLIRKARKLIHNQATTSPRGA